MPLDSTDVLSAIKMVDSNPTNDYDARGTSIFAATVVPETTTLALLSLDLFSKKRGSP